MNHLRYAILGLVIAGFALSGLVLASCAQAPPNTPVRPVTDVYFGREIVDHYRWLENLKDPEVLTWLHAQNNYTRAIMATLPWRNRILDRIRELDLKSPPPIRNLSVDKLGRYYFIKNGADGIARAYVRDPKTETERLVIDPRQLQVESLRSIALTNISPSPDGRYVAFVVRDAVAPRLYIVETATGEVAGMPVTGILGFTGLDWDPDSKSIYIVKLPTADAGSKTSEAFLKSAAYRHLVGADPKTDQPIIVQGQNRGLELKETSWPFVFPLPDPKFLAVWVEDGSRTGHALYIAPRADILAGKGQWKKIADFDNGATHAAFHGGTAYLNVPRKDDGTMRIVAVDATKGDISVATPVVLPDNGVVSDVEAASDALYVTVRQTGTSAFYRVTYDGIIKRIDPSVGGTVDALMVSPLIPGGIFRISSWTQPAAIYRFDPRRGWTDAKFQPMSTLGKSLGLVSEEVNVRSHDGVEVPLTIIYRRGLRRDSSNPTFLVGYGSYGATIDPGFDNVYVPWFEAGGILAYAHVRGGGELGEAWHTAGSKDKKRNTWLDFIACAEYLVDRKYTSPAKLAGGGTSAGGILIGRAITARPDLFRAATISVGTTDMLRAEYQMNGPANIVEFGTTKDKLGFEQLFEMSAYHHVVRDKHYPAVMLTTGMGDPNVDVWQPAKMTAILQSVADPLRPVLLRIDPEAGHDQYSSTRAQIQSWRADQLAFLMWQLGVVK
jgi:prolyl oligopeptidase